MSSKAKNLDFEKALSELEALVARLEEGKTPLDESIRQFERAMTLAKACQAALTAAEQKVEIMTDKGPVPAEGLLHHNEQESPDD